MSCMILLSPRFIVTRRAAWPQMKGMPERLDVSPNSFIHSSAYAGVYSTCVISLIYDGLVGQSASQS
eukprot:8812520-Pyramimonas_sp.AAC.1